MRVLRAADHRRMAWKNGGGETLEVWVEPANAGLDTFDWRVSMARIERDGPFSAFPGIDRTLSILSGAGIRLTLDGGAETALTPADGPSFFAADHPAQCALIGGPVLDLNVMTRRGRFAHIVRRLRVAAPTVLARSKGVTLVVCQTGTLTVADSRLAPCDCALVEADEAPLVIGSAGPAHALAVTIWRNGRETAPR